MHVNSCRRAKIILTPLVCFHEAHIIINALTSVRAYLSLVFFFRLCIYSTRFGRFLRPRVEEEYSS